MKNVESTIKNWLINLLNKIRNPLLGLDQGILLCIVFLLGFGLVQVYSASYIFATETYSDGLFFFRKQFLFSILFCIVLLAVANIPWQWIERHGSKMWYISSVLLFLTLIPGIGVKVGGASRWLNLGLGFRFEPSEILRVSMALLLASYIRFNWAQMKWPEILARTLVLILPMLALLKQPDFGNFFINSVQIFVVLFCFGLAWRYVFSLFAVSGLAFFALIWFVPYRKARFLTFLDPWSDPSGDGFQVIQSMMSFYNGGLTGVGLGKGQGKLFFLPEAHTDFTMAVLGEEAGFIGVLLLISLFFYLLMRGMQIAFQTQSSFARALSIALITSFSVQVFINMGVAMGLLPTKGITLAFLSYGGSSLLGSAFLFGLLLNIRRQKHLFTRGQDF